MLKAVFFILVLLNLVAFYYGAMKFFVDFEAPPLLGVCSPDALSRAAHEASDGMQNFLIPAALWLVGIAVIDLVFAGVIIFRRPGKDA